jgi:tRNA(Ile)-lysidine synthase
MNRHSPHPDPSNGPSLADRFRAVLSEIAPTALSSSPVVVGVSGGPDSMALLHLMAEIARSEGADAGLRGALHAVHVNYQLRGRESDKDQELVESFCREHSIPAHVFKADPAEVRKDAGGSGNLQDWARSVRYAHFMQVAAGIAKAREIEAQRQIAHAGHPAHERDFAHAGKSAAPVLVMTAHHRDDQLETILMKVLRGAGMGQWKGMEPVSPMRTAKDGWVRETPAPEPLATLDERPRILLVRPLLDVTKHELLDYVSQHGVPYRIDASNEESGYARNFLRHHLRPEFDRLTPGWEEHVLVLRERAEEFRLLAELALDRCRTWDEGGAVVDETQGADVGRPAGSQAGRPASSINRAAWLELPSAVRPVVLAQWLRENGMSFSRNALQDMSMHLETLQTGRSWALGSGVAVWRDRDRLVLKGLPVERGAEAAQLAPLATPGAGTPHASYRIPATGQDLGVATDASLPWSIAVDTWRGPEPDTLSLAAESLLNASLELRPWAPGDRIQPFGMTGHQLVSDLLTNRKVSALDKSGCLVLWVRPDDGSEPWIAAVLHAPSGTISERARCGPRTPRCLVIMPVAQSPSQPPTPPSSMPSAAFIADARSNG